MEESLIGKAPGHINGRRGKIRNVRCRRCRPMAICRRMPDYAALTDKGIIEDIDIEKSITEKMVLAIMWGISQG